VADLTVKLWDLEFPNPIWTAAGPGAADAELLARAARGGAGGLVTKTISLKPAEVPVPNIASPFSGSLLNAELWSEMDYSVFIEEVLPAARKHGLPLIVSVGYSPEDLEILGRALQESGQADAVEFSIHYVGKEVDNLTRTARALKHSVSVPVLAKLSPSVQDIPAVVRALEPFVDGFVAMNSLGPALDFDPETLQPTLGSADGRGWLSGGAILPVALHLIATIAASTKKPVIGVGGIRRVVDVVKMLQAGASAVQICSLAILKGQNIYGALAAELNTWIDAHGLDSAAALTGTFLKRPAAEAYTLGQPLYPRIDPQACTYCGLCERSCLHRAIHFEDTDFQLNRKRCVSCGLCVSVCPQQALSLLLEKGEQQWK